MATLMYDSVTAGDVPSNAPMVAGYVSGHYAWSAGDWARFTTTRRVRIVTTANVNDGDVLDCERGDAVPAECPAWIRARQSSGLWRPTIYCELSAVGAVRDFCLGLDYDIWVAHYTGQQHCPDGFVACQYADPNTGSGGHYDLSWVVDSDWPHRTAPTQPTDNMEEDMPTLVHWDTADYIVGYDAATNEYWRRTLPNLSREAQIVGGGAVRTNNGVAFPVGNDQFLTVYVDRGEA